jgi:hypothetical protein
MRFLSDPYIIDMLQAKATSMDPDELLNIVAQGDLAGPIDDTVEIGKRFHPEKEDPENEAEAADMGDMRSLPFVLLQDIVEHLDLRSALNFSLVNRIANSVVEESPVTFLKKWAPGFPRALSFTRIIRSWTILQLKNTIRSGHCVSCGNLTKTIWLANMERCCQPCMQHNQAYWCLNKKQTTVAFALTMEEIDKIRPIFVMGLLDDNTDENFPNGLLDPRSLRDYGSWVYPIKHTLARALEVYGSREAVKAAAEEVRTELIGDPRFVDIRGASFLSEFHYDHFRDASLKPLTSAQLRSPEFINHWSIPAVANGGYFTAPVVPHAQTQLIIHGCRGCIVFLTHPHTLMLDEQERKYLGIDPFWTPEEAYVEIYRRAYRMRTVDEMVEHIRTQCLGGWSLIHEELERRMPQGWMSQD